MQKTAGGGVPQHSCIKEEKIMRDNQPLLGQLARQFYSDIAQVLLRWDYRLYQQAWNTWRIQQGKQRYAKSQEARSKRITEMLNSLRRPS